MKVWLLILTIVVLAGGVWLYTKIAGAEARIVTAEAKLGRLNQLHHWIADDMYNGKPGLYISYKQTHMKVWTGTGDPPVPPPPPPPMD